MGNPFLSNPQPDFPELDRTVRGLDKPSRAHVIEIGIDHPFLQQLQERYLDEPWIPLTDDTVEAYYRQIAWLWYRLGYECLTLFISHLNMPARQMRVSPDTKTLPLGQKDRHWAEEGQGVITSWADFDAYPWDEIVPDHRQLEAFRKGLPPGCKMTVMPTVFTQVQVSLLGSEGLFYLLHDDPDLVAAVFERWGQIIYDLYAEVIDMEEIGALWHADDLGFTTSTLIAPDDIRKLAMPWYVKFGELAHAHDKGFWLHCCGNVYATGIIEDLIEDAKLDAFHSFQDPILPVNGFVDQYGERIAALGGVDMDKLCRLGEEPLRQYMRDILDHCVPRGRFVFGSGNTVTNYTPMDHYCWLLEEARSWRP